MTCSFEGKILSRHNHKNPIVSLLLSDASPHPHSFPLYFIFSFRPHLFVGSGKAMRHRLINFVAHSFQGKNLISGFHLVVPAGMKFYSKNALSQSKYLYMVRWSYWKYGNISNYPLSHLSFVFVSVYEQSRTRHQKNRVYSARVRVSEERLDNGKCDMNKYGL